MKKEEKTQLIESLSEQLKNISCLYITDTSELNVEVTNQLRRCMFQERYQIDGSEKHPLAESYGAIRKGFFRLVRRT
jgi:hypothetical protein